MSSKFYSVLSLLVSTFALSTQGIQAEQLSFRPGEKVTYQISESADCEVLVSNIECKINLLSEVVMDVTLISKDDLPSSPYYVQLVLRDMRISQMITSGGYMLAVIDYDPADVNNLFYSPNMASLLNFPLTFKINDRSECNEMTGRLSDVLYNMGTSFAIHSDGNFVGNPSLFGLTFGTNEESFALFLSQLFHLSGDDLNIDESYNVNVNFGKSMVSSRDSFFFTSYSEDFSVDESLMATYLMTSTDDDKVVASVNGGREFTFNTSSSSRDLSGYWWNSPDLWMSFTDSSSSSFYISSDCPYFTSMNDSSEEERVSEIHGNVQLTGVVEWNRYNALSQQRHMELNINANGSLNSSPFYINNFMTQQWTSSLAN